MLKKTVAISIVFGLTFALAVPTIEPIDATKQPKDATVYPKSNALGPINATVYPINDNNDSNGSDKNNTKPNKPPKTDTPNKDTEDIKKSGGGSAIYVYLLPFLFFSTLLLRKRESE